MPAGADWEMTLKEHTESQERKSAAASAATCFAYIIGV
jgi:hypothetical protein